MTPELGDRVRCQEEILSEDRDLCHRRGIHMAHHLLDRDIRTPGPTPEGPMVILHSLAMALYLRVTRSCSILELLLPLVLPTAARHRVYLLTPRRQRPPQLLTHSLLLEGWGGAV